MRGSASCCMWRCWCSGRLRARPPARSPHASLTVRSGRSRSPPVPSGPYGALYAGGACVAGVSLGVSSRSPPVPSGPSGALYAGGACVAGVSLGASSRSPARLRHRPRAPQLGQRGYCASSTFACNSSVTISVFELASLELQRFWALLKVHAIELHAESLVCVSVVTYGHRSRSLLEARPVSPDPPAPSTPAALALLGCRLVRRLEARPGPPPPTSAAAWSTRLLCV